MLSPEEVEKIAEDTFLAPLLLPFMHDRDQSAASSVLKSLSGDELTPAVVSVMDSLSRAMTMDEITMAPVTNGADVGPSTSTSSITTHTEAELETATFIAAMSVPAVAEDEPMPYGGACLTEPTTGAGVQ